MINPWVDDRDIFIGMLNRRWGTPTGAFSSGFEEEYERALGRTGDFGPAMALFFRQLSAEETADPGEQLQQVLAFQQRVREERKALYATFGSTDDLELKIVRFLSDFLAEQAAMSQQPPATADSPASASGDASAAAVAEATESGSSSDVTTREGRLSMPCDRGPTWSSEGPRRDL